jgi:hypothetical protein
MISFTEFQSTIEENLNGRLVFKDLTQDDRTKNRQDLPLYEFQDNDPGFYGHYDRNGVWYINFNGSNGVGNTLVEAYTQLIMNYDLEKD